MVDAEMVDHETHLLDQPNKRGRFLRVRTWTRWCHRGLRALRLRRVADPEPSADVLHELDQASRSLLSLGRVSHRSPAGDRRVDPAIP
jgi:hypothetical protein